MVLPLSNNAEGGTNGATATANAGGNTGDTSGDYFTSVVGEAVFSNAQKANGSLSYKLTQVVSGQAKVAWGATQAGSTTSGTVFTRHYVFIDAAPASNILILQVRGASSNSYSIRIGSSLIPELLNNSSQVAWTAPSALPTGKWIRIETRVVVHATDGRFSARFYWDDGSGKTHHGDTPVMTVGDETTAVPTRGTVDEINFGIMTAATGNSHYVDEMKVQTNDWIGTAVPQGAPQSVDHYVLNAGIWKAGTIRRISGGQWA